LEPVGYTTKNKKKRKRLIETICKRLWSKVGRREGYLILINSNIVNAAKKISFRSTIRENKSTAVTIAAISPNEIGLN